MDHDALAAGTRRLRARADAIFGAVWCMPERHTGFTRLGLSPAASALGGRAACMGPVPGEVAVAAFGCIEPTVVLAAIGEAWSKTTPEELLAERLACARRYLVGLLGPRPDGIERAVELLRRACEAAPAAGHPLFAGLRSLPWPGDPMGDLWRACEMVRERRGDSHVNAWQAAGLDGVEINVLSELWRDLRVGQVAVGQMGWPPEAVEEAHRRLVARGLVDGGGLTPAGRELRDGIERATDVQERPLLEALGADLDELLVLLEPWARTVLQEAAKLGETYDTMRRR